MNVPKARLELANLAALAPETSVSTISPLRLLKLTVENLHKFRMKTRFLSSFSKKNLFKASNLKNLAFILRER